MPLTRRPIAVAPLLAAAGLLGLAVPTSQAQVSGATYPRAYPGYYYSPGGDSGGYYFQPGYYPIPSRVISAPARSYRVYRPSDIRTSPAQRVYTEDWSTGRTNYPIPLTKPWMLPLR
jgi:hypothetical protein